MRFGWGIVFAVAAASTAHARGMCTVTTRKSPTLTLQVSPKGAAPFMVRVEGLPLTIEPGGLATPAQVHVAGALVFDANMPNEMVPVRTRRAVLGVGGMVHLAQATEKLTPHANVRSKLVDVDVKLPGGVELKGVTIPCDALTLDEVPEGKISVEDDGATRYNPKATSLQLRAGPNKGPKVDVLVDDPSALELRRLEDDGAWMRVTARWPDGTTLAGWAKREELVEAGLHHERLDMHPVEPGPPACEPATKGPNDMLAVAPVAVGTQVFATRYLSPWAKVAVGGQLQVRWREKDDWAQIVGAPGFACRLDDAWVPKSTITLPADAKP